MVIGERKYYVLDYSRTLVIPSLRVKYVETLEKMILNGTIKVSGGLLGAIGVAANDNHIVKLAKAA